MLLLRIIAKKKNDERDDVVLADEQQRGDNENFRIDSNTFKFNRFNLDCFYFIDSRNVGVDCRPLASNCNG